MFWGVTILGGRRYTQTVERSYHISKAVLEIPVDGKDTKQKRVQVMLEQNKSQYLLCNLDTDKNIQVDLDLIFTEGEDVTFYLNGEGSVHLTGYVLDFDDGDDFDDFDEDLSDEESEVVNSNVKRILSKADSSLNAKKAKINGNADDDEDDEEDDEEDDDALGALDLEAMDEDDEEDSEDDEEDDEEDEEDDKPVPIAIQQKKPQQPKQVNGQQPKVAIPGKGPQTQKNQQTGGKPTPQGGQQNQNKFGQKGQISPQGQKPFNQNQKGPQGQQQKGGQNKPQFNKAKGPFTPEQKASNKNFNSNSNNKFNKNKNRKSFA